MNPFDLGPDDYMLGLERRNEKLVKRLRQVEASLQASHRRNSILVEGLLQKTKQGSITGTTSTTVVAKNEPPAGLSDLIPGYRERIEIEEQERRNERIEAAAAAATALKSAKAKKEMIPAGFQNHLDLFGDQGREPNHIAVYNSSGGG